MKLLVDIPKKIVTAIQNGEEYRYDIHTAIAQGIPCEESSGDLISREALKKNIMAYKTMPEIRKAICEVIDDEPTVEPEKVYLAKVSFDKEQLQEIVDKAKAEVLSRVEWDEIVIRTAFKNYARKVMYEKNVTNFSLLKVFDEIIDNAPIQRGEEE